MATTTGTGTSFNSTTRLLANEEIQLLSNDIQCHLYTQANAPLVTHENLAETTPMSGAGYPGAVSLTTKSVQTATGKNHKYVADPIVFTATGGNIQDAYYWALFDNTSINKKLIGFGLLDDTMAPVSAAQNDSITINPNPTEGFLLLPTTT